MKVALTGDVALELMAPYFREAGFEVYVPAGFGTWRQELLDERSGLRAFAPDEVLDVTSFDDVLSREVPDFFDERMRNLASMPYSLSGIRAIVDEFTFRTLRGPKKILAVDADNTLWRGIISEDGMDAVEPFAEFQQGLLALRAKGVVLVLLSKNDPFEFRSDMPLANDDFAAVKVNWGPKAGNLIEACRELNLGVDSVVFVDDNPHERAQMSAHLPEVMVVPFPDNMGNPRQFLRRIEDCFFKDGGQTPEDALRAADYAAAKRRREWGQSLGKGGQSPAVEWGQSPEKGGQSPAATLDDYLRGLSLWVKPTLAGEGDLDRLAQMAGKTNQFNATTIRRTRDEFVALLADDTKRVYVFRAGDRFGEQGLVCYVVADLATKRLTDFVMSCRAMGRTLEFFAYNHVVADLGYEPQIDFKETAKNKPFSDFIARIESGERKSYY